MNDNDFSLVHRANGDVRSNTTNCGCSINERHVVMRMNSHLSRSQAAVCIVLLTMAFVGVLKGPPRLLRSLCSTTTSSSSSAMSVRMGASQRALRVASMSRRSNILPLRRFSSCAAAATAAPESAAKQPERKKRVISGVQPTGVLHIGNYFGAIKQWVDNQDTWENFFFIVDLHAITVPHQPKELKKSVMQTAALYLACGIDPEKSKIFVQSHVPAHAELTWLLNCATPLNWLERMIQFKEKARKQGENVSVGLLDYPVLMASDILLYQADLVPVGEDQRQHLELTRDIARRFNDQYCKGNQAKKLRGTSRPVFKEPEALLSKTTARIMSLQDGTNKMSKSATSDLSRINLLDTADEISEKIKRCKTDSLLGIEYGNKERPEATNLLNIYSAATDRPVEELLNEVQDLSWGQFKPLVADAMVEKLKPIREKYDEVTKEPEILGSVLEDGANAANEIASATSTWAKQAMGFTTLAEITQKTVKA